MDRCILPEDKRERQESSASSRGEYRGRRIKVPDRPDLRPTPDRVRETLFNWLGQWLDGLRLPRSVRGQRRARLRGGLARRGARGDGGAATARCSTPCKRHAQT